MPENKKKQEELEVKLDEVVEGQEVDIPLNPLEKLQQQQEETSTESTEKEPDVDKTYENERQIKLEEKKFQNIRMICLILLKFVKESGKK